MREKLKQNTTLGLNYLFRKVFKKAYIGFEMCGSYVQKGAQQLLDNAQRKKNTGHQFSGSKSNTIFQIASKINSQIVIFLLLSTPFPDILKVYPQTRDGFDILSQQLLRNWIDFSIIRHYSLNNTQRKSKKKIVSDLALNYPKESNKKNI